VSQPDNLVGTTIVRPGSSPVDCKDPLWPCRLGDEGFPVGGVVTLGSGQLSPGSIPTITTDVSGPQPLLFGGMGATWGPQLDVLVTNPYPWPVETFVQTFASPGFGILEPAATISVSTTIPATTGANNPPIVLPVPVPASLTQQVGLQENVGGAGQTLLLETNARLYIPTFSTGTDNTIPPGGFMWISQQLYIETTGFTGSSVWGNLGGSQLDIFGRRAA